jgi:phosphoribosylglycinamide formyltransferase-1
MQPKNNKKIAVLTYPVKHRKTYDTLSLLKANGYDDVSVCAIPYHYTKKKFPIYEHRPEMNYRIPELEELCGNLGFRYTEGKLESFDIEEDRIVLIAGAGILPDAFVKSHIVINAHPGYIPNCRGLDAFKWAIAEKQPVGVTTHRIGDYVDAGEVIERRTIAVKSTDTFHAVAERVYENEVSMLIEAVEAYSPETVTNILPGEYELHKRMPVDIERNLMPLFDEYKQLYAVALRSC